MKAINTRDDIIVIMMKHIRSSMENYEKRIASCPNYLGFTGTPLISDEVEKTKELLETMYQFIILQKY